MKVSSLHDDLLWPCVAHACGMGEFDGSGKRVPIAERSPVVRARQFGVEDRDHVPAPLGETAYDGYCSDLVPAVCRHCETVVAAVFDRYFVTDAASGWPPAPVNHEERERAVYEDIGRYAGLAQCGLPLARTSGDIVFAPSPETTNLVLAVEGMDFVCSEEQIDRLLAAGVRVFALQYNHPNALTTGDCSEASTRTGNRGLTPLGRRVVERLFRVGAILDLAHAAPGTRAEVLDIAEEQGCGRRVAYTHGATLEDARPDSRARMPGRFLRLEEVSRIIRMGGIVGLTPARPFFASLEQFTDRVSRLYRSVEGGAAKVALGTDFGGLWDGALLPEVRSVADVWRIGDMLAERHGFTDDEVDGVLRTNATAWMHAALAGLALHER